MRIRVGSEIVVIILSHVGQAKKSIAQLPDFRTDVHCQRLEFAFGHAQLRFAAGDAGLALIENRKLYAEVTVPYLALHQCLFPR